MTNTSAPAATVVTQERKVVTAIPGPKSQEMMKRRNAVISAGVGAALPVFIENAHGSIVVDVDGNQFIDFAAGIGVTTVGHSNDGVVAAVAEQAGHYTHLCFTVTPYEGYVAVAEQLIKHTPGNHDKRVMLANSGAEAVENAVKFARKFTGKNGVGVIDHAYHGRTNLTMGMNFKNAPYGTGFGPLGNSVFRAPSSYPFHDGLSGAEAAKRTLSYFEKIVGAEDLACIFMEPIQGEGGFVVPADGYLAAIQEWCTANNVVFVADEVQSGIARTGDYFATTNMGVVPDMMTVAKGIAGGMPLSAVVGRADIMDSVHVGGMGGTYGGNPVACAAALSVFEQLEDGKLFAEAKRIEKTLGGGLRQLQEKYPVIGDVRGRGAMLAIELVQPGTKDPNPDAVKKVIAYGAQNGLLLLSAGSYYNVLRFLPAVTTSDALLEDALSVLDEALASL